MRFSAPFLLALALRSIVPAGRADSVDENLDRRHRALHRRRLDRLKASLDPRGEHRRRLLEEYEASIARNGIIRNPDYEELRKGHTEFEIVADMQRRRQARRALRRRSVPLGVDSVFGSATEDHRTWEKLIMQGVGSFEPTRPPRTYRPTTKRPTRRPTRRPTAPKTPQPTPKPTRAVTSKPTRQATQQPMTPRPTRAVTPRPTRRPTQQPMTPRPTAMALRPTTRPTKVMTTPAPTRLPQTPQPTEGPTQTNRPTQASVTPATSDPTTNKPTRAPVEPATPRPTRPPGTRRPTEAPRSRVSDVVLGVALFEGSEFDDPDSYQSQSLSWLENSNTEGLSDERIIQRYALACIFYATNEVETIFTIDQFGEGNTPPWETSTRWVTNRNECEWARISCDEENYVTILDLVSIA